MNAFFRKYWPVFFITVFLFFPKSSFAAEWTNMGFADKNLQTVFVHPKNNNKILVGIVGGTNADRNYVTEDGGQTWTVISMGGATTNCNQFAVNPNLDTEYWGACSNGLYHSVDGGKSFSRIGRYTINVLTVNVTSGGKIFVTYSSNGIDYSSDGIIWQNLVIPGVASQPYLYINPYNENQIFVSKNGSTSPGLYRSDNGGSTWLLVNNASPIRTGLESMVFLENGSKICGTTGIGYGCSIDLGYTWTEFVSPNPAKPSEPSHAFQACLNPDDSTNVLIFVIGWNGLDGKIYSYENGSVLPKIYSTPQYVSYITISQGVVYAGGKNSTWIKGLWRNDGVLVVPEYLKKHPVIIVPGILGSWYMPMNAKLELDPVRHTYDGLYMSLVNSGLVPEEDIFTFPYQWRNDNKITASLLANKISEVKAKTGAKKVDIVAHSMGGLVARFYAQSDIYQGDIDEIFFLGTPQLGSSKAYPVWEAAYTGYEDTPIDTLLSFLITEEAIAKLKFGPLGRVEYVQSDIASVKQLLPVYQYINYEGNIGDGPINSDLIELNNSRGLLKQRGIRVVNIIGDKGYSTSTLRSFTVKLSNNLPYWEYGEPIGLSSNDIFLGTGFSRGDGTVPIDSQSYIEGTNYILAGVEHIDIPDNSAGIILKELGLEETPTITSRVNKILMVKAYSPVDFYVLAPDGKKIGFNKDGVEFNEINGAFYTGNASETEFLTIPDPLPGEYKVVTYGTGTGSYEIEATYADDEQDTSVTSSYIGETVPARETNILVDLSLDTNTIETKVDDKIAPITTATLQGTEIEGYYNTNVIVNLTAIDDESGIKRTEYSVDGLVWQDYSQPIILTEDGENTVSYRSIDQSDNVEGVNTLVIKIDKTAPTVSIGFNKPLFTHWDALKLDCKVTDSYSGIREFIVMVDGNNVNCDNYINLFDQNVGLHKVEYEAYDLAGNVVGGTQNYWIIVSYDSIDKDIIWLYENANFKTLGGAISLLANINIAEMFDTIDMERMATEKLTQAQLLLDKLLYLSKITVYGYDMITRDINYLLEGK